MKSMKSKRMKKWKPPTAEEVKKKQRDTRGAFDEPDDTPEIRAERRNFRNRRLGFWWREFTAPKNTLVVLQLLGCKSACLAEIIDEPISSRVAPVTNFLSVPASTPIPRSELKFIENGQRYWTVHQRKHRVIFHLDWSVGEQLKAGPPSSTNLLNKEGSYRVCEGESVLYNCKLNRYEVALLCRMYFECEKHLRSFGFPQLVAASAMAPDSKPQADRK